LDEIYIFFKPMPETSVWSNGKDEVCVSWQKSTGYVRWFDNGEEIQMEWIAT
jgi:hypothetical protein